MNRKSSFDPSRRLDLYFRINRIGGKTLVFLNAAGNPYEISAMYTEVDFELFIKQYPGARTNTIHLTVGSGIEYVGTTFNELSITVTADQSKVDAGEYYWELYLPGLGETWLSGKAYFHEGEFDGVVDTAILQIEEDATINLTINL